MKNCRFFVIYNIFLWWQTNNEEKSRIIDGVKFLVVWGFKSYLKRSLGKRVLNCYIYKKTLWEKAHIV
jgi:hypothetical protein